MNLVTRQTDKDEWDALVRDNNGHPLQSWGWGDVKAAHGWQVDRIRAGEGGAQLLIKRLPRPFGPLIYVPRGPFGQPVHEEAARRELIEYVKKTYRPTVLTIEPDREGLITWKGWRRSSNRILLARTAVMDLTKSEDELLAMMSKKTRQYIRKSGGEGLVVRRAANIDDVNACLSIYHQTAERAGFALHDAAYYHDIFMNLGEDSPVYMVLHEDDVVAFLWPIVTSEVAFELYGGMSDKGQALRANYHLKWFVIRDMVQRGVRRYDVNGLLNDGVTAFKKGFIPDETTMSGTYDYPMSPLYPVWNSVLPMAKYLLQKLRR